MPSAMLALLLGAAPAVRVSPDRPDALALAQAQARQRIAAGLTDDLMIELAGGTYRLTEPLVFDSDDGGTAEHAVIWRAAEGSEVVLSGGVEVRDWRVAGQLWSAQVDGVGDDWYPRQLVIDGLPAQRARQPNGDATSGYAQLTSGALDEERTTYTVGVPPELLGAWANLDDIEICWLGNWEITRKRLQAIDRETGLVTLRPPHGGSHDAMRPGPGRPAFFENAREFVDAPGEWYLDRATGELTYFPRPGESPATAVGVLPRLTRLLELRGTAAAPVRNLHFAGLRFEHADWAFPAGGFNGIQASFYTPDTAGGRGWAWGGWDCIEPALEWSYAEGCSLTDGALRHLGGVGIRLRQGCHDNLLAGNLVEAIGASGIMLGECWTFQPWPDNDLPAGDVPRGNRIANNLVRRCGTVDHGAVGIWAAFCQGARIEHNLVYDLPYSGISVGFMWVETPTCARDNHVVANHVYDVLKVLCDGGCLYTLGFQPESTITGNLFHDAQRSGVAHGAPNNGIFFDQGSKGFHVADNLIYATSAEPVRFNLCAHDWQTWGDNALGGEPAAELIERYRREAGLEAGYRGRW